MCILQYDSEGTSQIILFDLCNIDSVIADLSFLNIVEAVDQVCDRCFSGSGRTDKCQFLSRFCKQTDVM